MQVVALRSALFSGVARAAAGFLMLLANMPAHAGDEGLTYRVETPPIVAGPAVAEPSAPDDATVIGEITIDNKLFFDAGKTWGRSPVGDSDLGVLKDIGLELRLAGRHSGQGKVVHVDLAFPLDGNTSIRNMQSVVETRSSF